MDSVFYYKYVAELALVISVPILIIVGAFAAELLPPVERWLANRRGFVDSEQSPGVRRCAVRLTSRRSCIRIGCAELLGELGDPTASPALLRALARYNTDVWFSEAAVNALAKLGDARALPALRRLSHGRNAGLMMDARAAVSAIEPQVTLLRSASAPEEALLRPAASSRDLDAQRLLRTASGRE